MKKIIVTLAVLLLASPAMAGVVITCTASGPNEVTVSFVASGESELVRAIALDVQIDDPCAWIEDITCVSAGYYIHPTNIVIIGNAIDELGSCAVGGNDDQSDVTEQGSLYADGAPEPNQFGDLFIITLGGCATEDDGGTAPVGVTVSENALRGGIVMEDANGPSVAPVLNGCTVDVNECVPEGCQCFGDVSGSLGVPDSNVSINDLTSILAMLTQTEPYKSNPPTYSGPIPTDWECADISGSLGVPDGFLSINDLTSLLSVLTQTEPYKSNQPTYLGPCLADPNP
jgi:hypothetical protein